MNNDNHLSQNGFLRLWKAFIYSLYGLNTAWRGERAFRLEVILSILMIPLATALSVSIVFKLILIATVLLVLVVELLNSAVEAVVDMVTEEFHPLAKKGKDMASAAVFVTLVLTSICWLTAIYLTLFPGE